MVILVSPAQSYRRSWSPPTTSGRMADMLRRPRRDGAERRNLLAHHLRWRARFHRQLDGMLEKTIILDGFSKTYSMTGWRLGYGVMPTWLAEAVVKLMVNSNSCTASFTQRAGIAALDGPQDAVTAMVAEFRRRRDAIVQGLEQDSWIPLRPACRSVLRVPQCQRYRHALEGARRSSAVRSRRGVSERRRFGAHGEGYLRFSYANSLANIQEALSRIQKASERWAAKPATIA